MQFESVRPAATAAAVLTRRRTPAAAVGQRNNHQSTQERAENIPLRSSTENVALQQDLSKLLVACMVQARYSEKARYL
jgi:hypothetical protein